MSKLMNCPRCGGEHDIELKELENPLYDPLPSDPKNPCVFHFWAICPTKQEPILVRDNNLDDLNIPIKPNVDKVAVLAYKIWETEGYPHGRDREHWLTAELYLTSYVKIPSPTRLKNALDPNKVSNEVRSINLDRMRKMQDKEFVRLIEKGLVNV